MSNQYKVHFNYRLASKIAASEEPNRVRTGSWFAPRGGLIGTGGPNRAQCRSKAQCIDWTTNPGDVTCVRCNTNR